MHGALLPASLRIVLILVASVQSEAWSSSVVVELLRPRIERIGSAMNLPSRLLQEFSREWWVDVALGGETEEGGGFGL